MEYNTLTKHHIRIEEEAPKTCPLCGEKIKQEKRDEYTLAICPKCHHDFLFA